MSNTLGDPDTGLLRRYYDFGTAFENVLRGGSIHHTSNDVKITDSTGTRIESLTGEKGKVYAYARSGTGGGVDDIQTLSLLNLKDVSTINWQVTSADDDGRTCNRLTNLTVSWQVDSGRSISHVWMASPDEWDACAILSLPFTTSGGYVTFTVPELHRWDVIWMR